MLQYGIEYYSTEKLIRLDVGFPLSEAQMDCHALNVVNLKSSLKRVSAGASVLGLYFNSSRNLSFYTCEVFQNISIDSNLVLNFFSSVLQI